MYSFLYLAPWYKTTETIDDDLYLIDNHQCTYIPHVWCIRHGVTRYYVVMNGEFL